MATQFDAVARISVDLRAFNRAAQQITREGGVMQQVFRNLQGTLSRIEIVEKRLATELSRSLRVYNQISQAARNYAQAISVLARNEQSVARGTQLIVTAFQQLRRALSQVQGLSEREAARLQRTLNLYNQMAQALNTLARAQNQMAQSTQASRRAEQQAARERQRATEAARRQALAEQRLALSRQQAATAARNAATAEANAQARLLRVQQQLAEARRRDEAAAARQASASQRTAGAFNQLSDSMLGVRGALGDLESLYRNLGQAVAGIGTAAISAAIAHEAAFAQIERVTQLAGAPLEELHQGFLDLAVTLPVSFEELARVGQLASQTGVANDQLLEFTDTVVRFSVTTGVASEQVTLMLARIIQMRDLPIQEVGNLASAILDLGISSASTEDEILKVTESIATVTDIFGLSIEATAGLASALATLRVRPQLARGSLTRVFAQLNVAVTDTGGAMATLQSIIGGTEESIQNLLRANPDEFFLRFIRGMAGTADEGGKLRNVLRDLGINAVRDIDMISRLANNYDLLADQVQRSRVEFLLGNRLQEQSQTIFETTRVRLENLRDAFQAFLAQAGEPFARVLGQVAEAATVVLQIITRFPVIATTIGVITAAVSAAVLGWVAYRVAVAAAFRGVLALHQAQSQLGTTSLTLSGALREYVRVQAQATAQAQALATAQTRQAAAQTAAARGVTTFNTAIIAQSGAINSAVLGMRNLATSTSALQANFAASTSNISAMNAAMSASAASTATLAASTANATRALGVYAVLVPRVFSVQQGLNAAYTASAAAATTAAAGATTNAAATTASATSMTIAARAASGLAAALTFLRNNWAAALGVVGLLATGVFILVQAFRNSGNAMAEASQEAVQAVGGLQAYEEALIRDTQAAEAARGGIEQIQRSLRGTGRAASEAGQVYRTLTLSTRELSQATANKVREDLRAVQAQQRAIELGQGDIETLRERAEGQGALADAARESIADLEALAAQEENYRQALQGTTLAIGEHLRALAQQQFETALLESGLLDTEDSYQRLSDAISATDFRIDDLFGEDAPQALGDINSELESLEQQYDSLTNTIESSTRVSGITQEQRDDARERRDQVEEQIEVFQLLQSVIQDNRQAFDEASRSAAILTQLGLDPLGDAAQADAEAARAAAAAVEEYEQRIADLAETYSVLIDPALAWAGANDEAVRSVEAFTRRLRDQVRAQQEFARNLAILQSQGFDALVEQLRAAGPEGAAAAAELVDATDKQLQRLDNIARQAGASYTTALASAMDRVGDLDIGERAARNISESIVDELNRVSSAGGDLELATGRIIGLLDLIDQQQISPRVAINILGAQNNLLELERIINEAKNSGDLDVEGEAFLNTLLFNQAMTNLQNQVAELERRRDLDPNAEAHLSDDEYREQLDQLQLSVAAAILQGVLDIEGDASLNEEDYQEGLDFLENLANQANSQGDLDVEGGSLLNVLPFSEALGNLLNDVNKTNNRGRLDVEGSAHLNTNNFLNRQLPRVEQAAWNTGSSIQQALTRTATVSVVYSNVNSPPPSTIYAASGGWIHGPGGPTGDKIPARLSDGEFVVNAKAAKRYGSLLEAINAQRDVASAITSLRADTPRLTRSVISQASPMSATRQPGVFDRTSMGPVFNISNNYPQAEPTSVTINRSLAYAATISGV